jgi:hypothetical protein
VNRYVTLSKGDDMKYLQVGEKGKRGSKTNLTKGAFGLAGRKKSKYCG